MKILTILILAFILCTAGTQTAFSQTATAIQSPDSLQTLRVKVKGISCANDIQIITSNVAKTKGVSSCNAGKKGSTTAFEINYNPALITEKEIIAVIENTGSCENPDVRPYKVKQ